MSDFINYSPGDALMEMDELEEEYEKINHHITQLMERRKVLFLRWNHLNKVAGNKGRTYMGDRTVTKS